MQINIQEDTPFLALLFGKDINMGIRANTGLAEIEVNDDGDKICFSVSDNEFLKRISDFFEWFFGAKEEVEKFESQKENEPNGFKDFNLLVAAQEELSKRTMAKLDELFGDETSNKIFGAISPTFVCVADVIVQLAEEIERIANEHNQYFASKYSRRRKGANS